MYSYNFWSMYFDWFLIMCVGWLVVSKRHKKIIIIVNIDITVLVSFIFKSKHILFRQPRKAMIVCMELKYWKCNISQCTHLISFIFLINQSGRIFVRCKPPENSLMTSWSNYYVGILWRNKIYISSCSSTHFEKKNDLLLWEREKMPY